MDTTTPAKEPITDVVPESPQPELFADILDTEQYEKSMKNARIWLYVIAGFQAIMAIVEYSREEDPTIGMIAAGIDVFIALLFAGLALYSKKNPVVAFTTSLICYILIIAGLILLEPTNAFQGIIFKVLFIIALVKANRDARKYVALKQSVGEDF